MATNTRGRGLKARERCHLRLRNAPILGGCSVKAAAKTAGQIIPKQNEWGKKNLIGHEKNIISSF
jgi:hypothetical protein